MKKLIAGISFGVGASLLAGCGNSNPEQRVNAAASAKHVTKRPRIDHQNNGFEAAPDESWKLISITSLGESDLMKGGNPEGWEATFLRFNFKLGQTAVSCLVETDSDGDFPDQNLIEPDMCFINGDITRPITHLQSQPQ